MSLRHYLIVFDSEHQQLIAADDVGTDRDEALHRYAECEREYGLSRTRIQIVLVGAESLETIRRTHSQYFSAAAEDPFAELEFA